jgi:manganese transport protein
VKEDGYDLLVMGSHGHRAIGDVVFGQTVNAVRHAVTIPVLVVRPEAGPSEPAQANGFA